MKRHTCAALALIFLYVLGAPAYAQAQRGMLPHASAHVLNPSISLSAPATSPLQQQMRQDYATGLMSQQRELLQQNPSGLGRQEQAIGRALNNYTPQ
jgi:hypothetical protein